MGAVAVVETEAQPEPAIEPPEAPPAETSEIEIELVAQVPSEPVKSESEAEPRPVSVSKSFVVIPDGISVKSDVEVVEKPPVVAAAPPSVSSSEEEPETVVEPEVTVEETDFTESVL